MRLKTNSETLVNKIEGKTSKSLGAFSGFDKDYELTTSNNPDPEEYDLSPYILNTDLTN